MGDRPQAILNKQVLERADLLIGIFWTRIGTPTGDAVSGTVEEIEKHISLGKPAMLYFSSAPVHPDSVDTDQLTAVREFRERCKSTGLIQTYDDLVDFRTKLSRQLAQTVNDNSYIAAQLESLNWLSRRDEPRFERFDPLTPPSRDLSERAKSLLTDASMDPRGTIIVAEGSTGKIILTNNKTLGGANNPRVDAEWTSALEELMENELIKMTSATSYDITSAGYNVADKLRPPR
jgi:hypothetical protein